MHSSAQITFLILKRGERNTDCTEYCVSVSECNVPAVNSSLCYSASILGNYIILLLYWIKKLKCLCTWQLYNMVSLYTIGHKIFTCSDICIQILTHVSLRFSLFCFCVMLLTADHMKHSTSQQNYTFFSGFEHIWKHLGLKQVEQGQQSNSHFLHFYVENKNSVSLVSKVPKTFVFKCETQSDEWRMTRSPHVTPCVFCCCFFFHKHPTGICSFVPVCFTPLK